MSQHALAIRLGEDDVVPVQTGDYTLTQVQCVRANNTLIQPISDTFDNLATIGLTPTEVAIDLFMLAFLVYAADTQVSRSLHAQDNWTREMRLIVPVSDADKWSEANTLLQEMLAFLTGDIWDISFRSRPSRFQTLANSTTMPFTLQPSGVQLFSGGMDSLIGAIDQLALGKQPILVSHAGEGATSKAQQECFDRLKAHFQSDDLQRVRMWLQWKKKNFKGLGGESTTRARSFLFFALGVVVASSLPDSRYLKVPENGFIALNVPLDQSRVGSLSTRTTHPFYMARWQDLLNVLELDINIDNPYWDKTKGEMVAECEDQDFLVDLLTDSLSCSSPSKARFKGIISVQHCGYCLPCIIRRASLLAGLKSGREDPTMYTLKDLTTTPVDTKRSAGQQIRAFQVAIDRLDENPGRASILINKSGPLRDFPDRRTAFADVYRRGIREVADLLQNVITTPQ